MHNEMGLLTSNEPTAVLEVENSEFAYNQRPDGHNHNLSWNCGAEGETDDPAIRALREQQKRNLLATLLLSQGVPMLHAGDEIGRTQGGNSNAYCQDNTISWLDWNLDEDKTRLLDFTSRLIALRRAHPVFRRRDFFQGRPIHGGGVKDIVWFKPDGTEMTDDEWQHAHAHALGVYLSGAGITETDGRGRPVRDDDFLVLFSSHHESIDFLLPALGGETHWIGLLDTGHPDGVPSRPAFHPGQTYPLGARSLALLLHDRTHPGPATP